MNTYYNENVVDFVESLTGNIPEAVTNLHTQLDHYTTKAGWCFPYTVNNEEYNNTWICSPYTALVAYSVEESRKIDSAFTRKLISTLLPALGGYLRHIKLNRIVHCNNWLLSTNLYPDTISQLDISEIKQNFIQRHPHKSIIFRSLNKHSNRKLLNYFKNEQFLLVPSRQVYVFDKNNIDFVKKRDTKKDLKLLKHSHYTVAGEGEFNSNDFIRSADLYRQLYIKKYSTNNPFYTAKFLEALSKNGNFSINGFRNRNGILDAVVANFTVGNTTSTPIIGYDLSEPQEKGLYRLASAATLNFANDNDLIFNASSGVPDFKVLRGADSFIEYSAVYVNHLPAQTRWAWQGISKLLNSFYVALLEKYQL